MKVLFLAFILPLSAQLLAADKSIYGMDNREEFYEVLDTEWEVYGRATAVQIKKQNMELMENEDNYFVLGDSLLSSLTDTYNGAQICEEAPFLEQEDPISCSGFLIAPDLIVTAGHCVRYEEDCEDRAWIFDYALKEYGDESYNRPSTDQVYFCEKIISKVLHEKADNQAGLTLDYAIIKLNRPVTDRQPLTMRKKGKVSDNANLLVVGASDGLPLKIADGGQVLGNDTNHHFLTSLDSFHGNSGSPVIDLKTGLVEGVLTGGEADWIMDQKRQCLRPKVCSEKPEDSCVGEKVVRSTYIK